jgi:hypothetical protein
MRAKATWVLKDGKVVGSLFRHRGVVKVFLNTETEFQGR